MKKVISGALILVLLLSCLLVTATSCGNSNETSSSSNPTTSATQSSAPTTASSASGSLSWNDMPIYGGATEIQKANWSIPPSNDSDYAKMEWRYYEVKASIDEVASFYKQQMPAKGWSEQGWMETPEMNWGMFNRNDEKDAAMVWVSAGDEDKSNIALWRATK